MKSKSKLNKILLVIIIILFTIGLVYVFFIKFEKRENVLIDNSQQENQSKQIQNKLPAETSVESKEDSASEFFKNQPGEIKSIRIQSNNSWILDVDLLSSNPDWLPGVDSSGEYFVNRNPKIRSLNVTSTTKTYNCGPDTTPNVLQDASNFIQVIQKGDYKNRYFDINNTNITAMYEQCLP